MTKITLIGAGSVVFAKNLISDILQHEALADATICLMDIDPDRLRVAEVMARRIVEKLGALAKIKATTSRRTAVRGAHYVICTIQVGGYKPCTVIDFEIPARYGLKQTIADTLGIGGIFRGLRTIPELNQIARDIAEVGAPDCLFLNYTNPMAMNCMGIDRATGVPHVGLCHSVQGTSKQLASYAGLPVEDISYLVAGINHMAFFLKFDYRGQDAYPLLFRALEQPQTFARDKVRFEMMRRLGYFVTESSEHQSEYSPHFIHHGQQVIDDFDIPIDEYLRRCEAIISTWQETERKLIGEDGDIEVKPQTHEYGSFIINARETHTPTVIYGNVPNRGLITNLPTGCCVEVPVLVDRNGLQPTVIGDLPPQLAAICRSNVSPQELAVEAALTGKREHIYHAAMADPHTAATLPLDKIWAMCDDLIAAHQKEGFLGEFSPVLKNTGRGFAGVGDRVLAQVALKGSFDPAAGAKNRFVVSVENPSARSLSVSLALSTDLAAVTLPAKGGVKLTVAPGKTKSVNVVAVNTAEVDATFQVGLTCARSDVLCQGATVPQRTRVTANARGEVAVELELHGNPAVEARFKRTKTHLKLHAQVADSNIKPAYEALTKWYGSVIELHLAQDADAPITECYLIPASSGKKARIIDSHQKPIAGARIRQRTTNMYYVIDAEIPLAAIKLRPDAPSFLFDLVCGLGSLGDAHSGGQTSLAGNWGRWRDAGNFWLAEF